MSAMDICDNTQGTCELSAAEEEMIEIQKEKYQEEKRYITENWHLIKQPGAADDANCLIASVLNCVDSDYERHALLGITQPGREVDYQQSEAYAEYARFFTRLRAEPKKEKTYEDNVQYTATGMYLWLEHLVQRRILKQYTWKRVSNLEQGLGAWFGDKMEKEGKGKRYVIFGYHPKASGTHELNERLREIRGANPKKQRRFKGNTGTWARNLGKIIDRWAAMKKRVPPTGVTVKVRDQPPVEGLMGPDPACVDEEARRRTLNGVKLPKVKGAVTDWCNMKGITMEVFQKSLTRHRRRVVREMEEKLRVDMHRRDATTGRRPAFKPLGVIPKFDDADQAFKAHETRMKSLWKRAAGTDKAHPVTLHGIAARVLDNGGIILLDPAAQAAKYMHVNDVYQSCVTFLSACTYYWAVYEISVEVA